jgi:hypothetical protein
MAHILQQVGRPLSSVGSIAQRLAAAAQALPPEAWPEAPIVFLVCAAILTLGQPMLLTVEPRALAILQRELGEHRAAATWTPPWDALGEAGLREPPTVVSAHGPGLVNGGPVLGRTHPPDVLHLRRPRARFGERFARKALAASARA